jgi:phosphatidylinositol alpha-1,6-mannosyltransferase
LGPVDDDTLSDAYFAADVMVFPVQEVAGDVEGFGMVAIEAAAHDLPTVAFAVGGVPDAIANGRSGSLIEARANGAFAESVVDRLQSPRQPLACRKFAQDFSWQAFGERLLKTFEAIAPPPR